MKYLALSLMIAVLLGVSIPKTLEAPPFIHGYVYDASDSTAIDSARVEGKHLTEEAKFSTTTDANGYYAVYDTLHNIHCYVSGEMAHKVDFLTYTS